MSIFAKINRISILLALLFFLGEQSLTFGALQTPVLSTDFDGTQSKVFFNGTITAATPPPDQVVDSQTGRTAADLFFANTGAGGPRHLRYALRRTIPVGTIVVFGNAQPSVLKETATYPGDPTNENDWVMASRVSGSVIDPTTPPSTQDIVMWVFPNVVNTRAMRFTRVSTDSDANPGGRIAGIYVYSERFNNVAPQAQFFATANQSLTPAINNYRADTRWENAGTSSTPVISSATPERLIMQWPTPVKLAGLATIAAGFSEGTVQRFIGPDGVSPRDADDSMWENVKSFTGLRYYGAPVNLAIDNIEFPAPSTSRAFRILITKAGDPAVDTSLGTSTLGGRKIFVNEIMALYALGSDPLSVSIVSDSCNVSPPIPINFHLANPGYVTLVIEDQTGKRVRNLIAETFFPAGDNTAFWDGLDESGRIEGQGDGEYTVQGALVPPATYRVRGLVRDQLDLHYEFSVYTAGKPAWFSGASGLGGWLSDHRPASDVAYIAAKNELLMVSEVGEASAPGIYTDLNGQKTGALGAFEEGFFISSHLAQDWASNAAQSIATWSIVAGKKTVYVHTINTNRFQTQSVVLKNWDTTKVIGGLAVWGGTPMFSVTDSNQVYVLNTTTRTIQSTIPVSTPRGMTFDASGRLLVVSGTSLLRFTVQMSPFSVVGVESLISSGLEEPRRVLVERATGNIYISDWGNSHQVKVFDSNGAFIRSIGTAGPPTLGLYDPLHMNRPHGMAITPDGHLWVAEYDMAPKRISEWNLDGTFVNAFYGPSKYGGGGRLDPQDKTRWYYTDRDEDDPVPFHIGMEWRIDWTTGSNYCYSVYSRWGTNTTADTFPAYPPETAVYLNGRQYMVNVFNAADVGANVGTSIIWEMIDNVARPVAAFGAGTAWPILKTAAFTNAMPAGITPASCMFLWSDLNGDHVAEPNEMQYRFNNTFTSFQVTTNLDFITAHAFRVARTGFAGTGAPLYDMSAGQTVVNVGTISFTSGGGEMLEGEDGWFVLTGGPMKGYKNGQLVWSYPSQWPSLHSSHRAPTTAPTPAGLMVGTTRVLGVPFKPVAGEAGQVWCINGNHGDAYLMTFDGLYIGRLFKRFLEANVWGMPSLARDGIINNLSLAEETFWPSITQTSDGKVYLTAGKSHSSIVRLDGLNSVKRIAAFDLPVTSGQLAAAADYQGQLLACKTIAVDKMFVAISPFAPKVDGNLSEWASTNFVAIDAKATGAVMIAQGKLYAAWMTDFSSISNDGSQPDALFKTGGALDLMIGTDPSADDKRQGPVSGDLRLLITKVGNVIKGKIYRQVSGNGPPVVFTSPVRSLTIQQLDDTSSDIQFASSGGNYEVAIPLTRLGLDPTNALSLRGDIGLLRGANGQTTQRSYAFNKATVIVSDTPTEAELTPNLWGHWNFFALGRKDAWRAIKFGANASAATVADTADPDNDGLINIVEYVLGTEPTAANNVANRPKPQIQTIDGKQYLTITYTQAAGVTEAKPKVESGGALNGLWDSPTVEISRTGTDPQTITVRDTVPLDQATIRYLRLNVTP